jgi:hypothetical protein
MLETISQSKPNLQGINSACLNDRFASVGYNWRMATPGHDWYLKEWLKTLQKKQADIVRDLDWNKARISLMLRGKQPYDRDSLNELAAYLNLKPHELLMHPADAMAMRRIKSLAEEMVSPPSLGTTDDVETVEKSVSNG